MGFLDELRLSPTEDRAPDHYGGVGNVVYELGQALRYQTRGGDRVFTVPQGYRTDLASIPQRYQQRPANESPAARAGALHDWFYTDHAVSRREADRIFRHALRDEGVPLGQRLAMWAAVRLNGGDAYAARSGWAVPNG